MISAASQPPVSPLQALGLLFDPSVSAVQLVDINVTGPRTIEAQWRMGGYLRFPCEWLNMVGLLGAVGSCAAAVHSGRGRAGAVRMAGMALGRLPTLAL